MLKPVPDEINELCGYFEQRYDTTPTYAACAPGRVNLIGDHTDYNEGFALPMAINRWAVVLARPNGESHSRLWFPNIEHDATADLTIELEPTDDDALNYILGIARGYQGKGHVLPNMDFMLASNVPIGAGLSSSAAIEVATAMLLQDVCESTFDRLDLAWLCQESEHRFVGTPCGIMDMYTALFAEEGHALLLDCRVPESNPLPLPGDDEMVIIIATTHVQHDLADGAYAERRSACEASARSLGLRALRDASIKQIEDSALSDVQRSYASHVVSENARVLNAAEAFYEHDLKTVGQLMFESHDSLAHLYDVSCDELDTVVNTARSLHENEQVFGARMTGGGFGGSAIILTEPDAVGPVVEQLRLAYHIAHDQPLTCTDVLPSGHAVSLTDELNGS